MSTAINPVQVKNTNTCPHGLPLGACPICNGGGGGSSKKISSHKKNPNEWSYAKCLSVGMQMKASKAHSEETKAMFDKQMQNALEVQKQVTNFVNKAQSILQSIQAKLPQPLQSIFANTINAIINPILNLISKIPQGLEKLNEFISDIQKQILVAGEKLTAVFGEIKNFVERNVVEKFKRLTKKIINFFSIFSANEENYQDDEILQIFKDRELKKIHKAIIQMKKEGKQDVECHTSETSSKTGK